MFFKKTLEDRVEKAKKNSDEMNSLIEEYKPFIASTVQRKTRRFMQYGHDDELSIGMMAFKEAIDCYDRDKGKFLSFAKQVITLRMIDYYRKNKKNDNIIYMDGINQEDEESGYDISSVKAIEEHKSYQENEVRRLEILDFKQELLKWNIEFSDLVDNSPKQEKLRASYKEVATLIASNDEIFRALELSGRLPIKLIQNHIEIHRKKLDRGRIYIISLVVILKGDYQYIREYLKWR